MDTQLDSVLVCFHYAIPLQPLFERALCNEISDGEMPCISHQATHFQARDCTIQPQPFAQGVINSSKTRHHPASLFVAYYSGVSLKKTFHWAQESYNHMYFTPRNACKTGFVARRYYFYTLRRLAYEGDVHSVGILLHLQGSDKHKNNCIL